MITNYSFEEIKRKAEELRAIFLRALEGNLKKKWETDWLDLPDEAREILFNERFAPLIGYICDWRIKSDYAFQIPWWFHEKLGSLEPNKILSSDISAILKSYFESEGKFPRYMDKNDRRNWITKTSKDIKEALLFFNRERSDPIEMFCEKEEYDAVEVYFMLRRIKGIGFKKANVLVRDFIHMSKGWGVRHPWFDQIRRKNPNFIVVGEEKTLVPIDVHVVKVFNRIFGRRSGNWKKEQEEGWWDLDIQMFAKLFNPEYPATLDDLFWRVGTDYCHDPWNSAKCSSCPINTVCDSSKV